MVTHDPLRGAGLDDHQRDVMGDDIVKITRDAFTFRGDGLAGLEVALAFEQAGAGGGDLLPRAQVLHDAPEPDGERDAEDTEDHLPGLTEDGTTDREPT